MFSKLRGPNFLRVEVMVVLEIERKLVVVIVLEGKNTDVLVVVVVVDGNNKFVALVVMVVGEINRNVVVVVEDGNNRNVVALEVAVVVEEGSNRNVLIALAVVEETIDVHFMVVVVVGTMMW